MADNSERIAEIEALLQSGVTSVNVDGVLVTIDPTSLRQELANLRGSDDTQRGRRPVLTSIDLSGCF